MLENKVLVRNFISTGVACDLIVLTNKEYIVWNFNQINKYNIHVKKSTGATYINK